jgi:tetratricopeptide (TPR) repeat protein
MKSTVFLSYSSSLSETATHIELSLKGQGFSVFRDRSMLPPGESFDARIRTAIEESDLFVFLISPESVSPERYTLTELKFAEQKWQHPDGRVLPVFAKPTPKESIPAFLRAVTVLQPHGDIAAEVAAEVVRLRRPWWRRMLEPRRLVPAIVLAVLLAGGAWMTLPVYLERRGQNAEAQALIKQSQSQAAVGDYAKAWELLEQANAVAPASGEVFAAQEGLAMTLLRGAGVSYSRSSSGNAEELVKRTLPVLIRGTSGANGERLANLHAHMGWADFLRGGRNGGGEPDPVKQYRRALEADPRNVYAHAMWGFELLRRRHSSEAVAEAKQHFSAALKSNREREYVRYLQVSALLQTYSNVWIEDPERQKVVLRVANEMRVNNETLPKGWGPGSFKGKMWAIYHFGFVSGDDQAPLLAALPPAEHLASFRWLFPEGDLAGGQGGPSLFDYLTVLAQLEEHGGDRAGALASYRRLLSEFELKKYNSGRAIKIADRAKVAIQRLAS